MRVGNRHIAQRTIFAVSFAVLGAAAARPQAASTTASHSLHRHDQVAAQHKKIDIALDHLDAIGLRSPPDGKVAVSYEFCIPDTKRYRAEVKRIDATVQFLSGSFGRIGAQKGQCLCIGTTHQPHYRTVLYRLAALPYVRRIIETYFE